MLRYDFARSKLLKITYDTSGLSLAASTNRIAQSFRNRSTLCFTGIKAQTDVAYICRIYVRTGSSLMMKTLPHYILDYRHAASFPEAGRYKSSLLLVTYCFIVAFVKS